MVSFDKSLKFLEKTLRYSIAATETGWEVREERNSEVVRTVHYQDWHRVERARRTISIELDSLRRQIAWVGQSVTLFDDSIARNIAYGALGQAGEAEIIAAAEAANAMEFIRLLPEGLDSRVGERGVLLSGGQRQRIAIARALLKNAPILILDEATSHLDTESEMLVQRALANLMEHRTVVVIAHRLSTIRRADKIVVLERGQIREIGTHQELVSHGGIYQRLHDLQFEVVDL